ncbi:MFS general substrate transporter [Aureobasidium pullulans EXF-150]|uniref:MFS general substrate transporter n=1 Tax=Aureobasidium pullulans EXF-150 TaxID=1043002 RepID=A0A074XN51_AURPU|nr:MFS general substrate transporter [Aureobasidium pullulans EXF-150]KEQ86948.1 MFS general substrate transporter [Aureobasidium pullulans EXF-150]
MSPSHAQHRRVQQHSSAFPTRQLFVLALCRICEPIAFMSIFPYVYYMISSFHITNDEKQISLYAGMVTSAFAFAEFSTGVLWGRLSDKVGRKPILLMGLAGTGISMIAFGFSPNLTTALIARALGGLLNGNIGVLQTTVAEVVTVEAHQARAYSIMPFVWCLGSIVGSGLGGTLADPVRNYPGYFEHGSLFDKFPYLLPNLVCAGVVIFGMVVGILFLEETHEDLKDRRDYGLDIGDWLLDFFRPNQIDEKAGETLALFEDVPPGYSSSESSPALNPILVGELPNEAQSASPQLAGSSRRDAAVSNAFTWQVCLNIVGYGILAYHTISAEQLLPVLFSLPESHEAPNLPFQFSGGFALPTKVIGFILSAQGFIQMFATLFVFPFVNRKIGSLATFRLVILSYPILYLMVPYLTLVPTALRMPCIYFVLVWKVTAQALSYPSLAIMLANAAPSKKVLGTLNGVAASSASLCRAFGPTLSGLVQSLGLSVGVLGLPWWANSFVALIGAVLSLRMVEEKRRYSKAQEANLDSEDLPFLDADVLESVPSEDLRN